MYLCVHPLTPPLSPLDPFLPLPPFHSSANTVTVRAWRAGAPVLQTACIYVRSLFPQIYLIRVSTTLTSLPSFSFFFFEEESCCVSSRTHRRAPRSSPSRRPSLSFFSSSLCGCRLGRLCDTAHHTGTHRSAQTTSLRKKKSKHRSEGTSNE